MDYCFVSEYNRYIVFKGGSLVTDYLIKLATKNNLDYKDKNVREKLGYLAGIVGLIINVALSIFKLIIGWAMSSIAVTADAINNISDSASSLMTLIGFKLASMPPDKEHPHGHGRIEYLTALLIACMVIIVGTQFIKTSIGRIINPQPVKFQLVSFIILVISIGLKLWLAMFNKNLGEKISSSALKASATDSLGDVATTSIVALSLLISLVTSYPIDGYIGVVVSILILYSGVSLVKETVSPLLGEAPDEYIITGIYEDIQKYPHIKGAHDLIVHNYGPGRAMATIDVEIHYELDLVTVHEIIDKAERELSEKYNLHLVIHMDPIGYLSDEDFNIRKAVKNHLKEKETYKSIHDFRICEKDQCNILMFDVALDGNLLDKSFDEESLRQEIGDIIKELNPNLDVEITFDIEYN